MQGHSKFLGVQKDMFAPPSFWMGVQLHPGTLDPGTEGTAEKSCKCIVVIP